MAGTSPAMTAAVPTLLRHGFAAQRSKRLRRVDVDEGALALHRHLDHRLAVLAEKAAAADVAGDLEQFREEAAGEQHRVAAIAVAHRHHRELALVGPEG